MKDRRPIVVVIIVLIALATFGVLSRDWSQSSADPVAPSASTTSSTVKPGEEWRPGFDRVTQLENDLFANPDPTRVDEVMLPECTCYSDTKNRLQALHDKGYRIDGANLLVDSVSLSQRIDDKTVQLFVVLSDNGKPVVDAGGKVIEASPNMKRRGLLYVLRSDGTTWKIAKRNLIDENGGLAQ